MSQSHTPEKQTVPKLVDRALLDRRRRAAETDALFLHDLAFDELNDRLSLVNRTFTNKTIVTGHPDYWCSKFPDAACIVDTDTLAFDPASQDLIIHAFSLHWASDPVGQLIQCRRALRPDGLFLACFPGGQTLHELRACLAEAEIAQRGGLSPRVVPMADIRDLGGLLQRAEFALPVADVASTQVEYDDIWHLMRDLKAMGEANSLTSRDKRPLARSAFEQADHIYQKRFSGRTKPISATVDLMCLTGWCPADSQPKPLRPGSAQMRLADALEVQEKPLQD